VANPALLLRAAWPLVETLDGDRWHGLRSSRPTRAGRCLVPIDGANLGRGHARRPAPALSSDILDSATPRGRRSERDVPAVRCSQLSPVPRTSRVAIIRSASSRACRSSARWPPRSRSTATLFLRARQARGRHRSCCPPSLSDGRSTGAGLTLLRHPTAQGDVARASRSAHLRAWRSCAVLFIQRPTMAKGRRAPPPPRRCSSARPIPRSSRCCSSAPAVTGLERSAARSSHRT
jgi:hypothetical protein